MKKAGQKPVIKKVETVNDLIEELEMLKLEVEEELEIEEEL